MQVIRDDDRVEALGERPRAGLEVGHARRDVGLPRQRAQCGGVAIDGRLNWREWDDQNGNKRQSIDIIADSVQFLGSRDGGGENGGGRFTPQSDVPADTADFASAPAGSAGDDDIPF